MQLAALIRHPIKSVGHERIAAASLTVGQALPFDREWAVAHEAAKFGPDLAEWAAKMNFLRGVAGPELMAIRAESDVAGRRVTLTHPRAGVLTLAPDSEGQALIDWLRPIWPAARPAPAFVVQVPGQAMTDLRQPYLSILNLATNRALGEKLGQDLSIHRWRGNLWLDGMEPFAEFDLLGRSLRIGEAELRVEQRITRCRATCVNPETGVDDLDTLAALNAHWGHQDFGVYALVTQAGRIAEGDKVTLL
ncbi:MOSC domain-containing protein [Neogemmobacter tilapiae]|uniref:Molybdenum cofactor biosysynthesis protein n=1 Tax=Neogemmobacter tilapiae TaxID=875041 RepID=A0A918TUU1_9RHOB|nr:MOSC domain-containing protein [Gemmobacter tilapiae]GHC63519.1 molybdenum cofactor biosysynthesis protein [Gemmobacter tilapiae]